MLAPHFITQLFVTEFKKVHTSKTAGFTSLYTIDSMLFLNQATQLGQVKEKR